MRGTTMIQVTLTETAANKVKELIQRNDPETGQPLGTPEDTYLRMYVAGGGCSGLRSNARPFWNTEHPPPATYIRRYVSSGVPKGWPVSGSFLWMSSLTLFAAVSVSVT